MIVFKNYYENQLLDLNDNSYKPIKFTINETILTLTKKYDDIYNTLQSFASLDDQNPSQIQILIPNLTQHFTILFDQKKENKNDEIEESNKHKKQSEHRKDYDSSFKSSYDDYRNEVFLKSNISLNAEDESNKYKTKAINMALEQLQLFLDGYDIIIPDFLVKDMMKIAEKLKMHKLLDELNPLNEEISNNQDYNVISELEILIKVEKEFLVINEENFNEKSSIIYSLYLYIGKMFFENIIDNFINFDSDKKSVYFQICEMICTRFPEFETSFKKIKEKYDVSESDTEIIQNSDILNFILKDDVDSLQKHISNPAYNIEKEIFYLPKENKCNAIEYTAFCGSLKCFKYLLLNCQLNLDSIAKYAVIGGNTEIIHICYQKKYNFKGTLLKSIYYHRNEIAKWIIDNNIDDDFELHSCVNSNNFEILQYWVNLKTPEINNTIMIKYLIYVYQYYHVNPFYQSLISNFLMRFNLKNVKVNDKYGLTYCPNGKVIIILSYFNNIFNEMKKEYLFLILFIHFQISILLCSFS